MIRINVQEDLILLFLILEKKSQTRYTIFSNIANVQLSTCVMFSNTFRCFISMETRLLKYSGENE